MYTIIFFGIELFLIFYMIYLIVLFSENTTDRLYLRH